MHVPPCQHGHQMSRPHQAGWLQKRILRARRHRAEYRSQPLLALLQRHDGHHIRRVAVHDRRRGQPRRASRSATAARQRRGEPDLRDAQHFDQAAGIHLIGIPGRCARIIREPIDLLDRNPRILARRQNGGADHLIDRARPALPPHIVRRRPDTDDGRLVLIDPDQGLLPAGPPVLLGFDRPALALSKLSRSGLSPLKNRASGRRPQ